MTNAEVIRIARETAEEIVKSATKNEYVAEVTKIRKGNGACVCIKAVVQPEDTNRPKEYYQVGNNCTVYAIQGEKRIAEAIKNQYADRIS